MARLTVSRFVALADSRGYTTKESKRKFLKWYLKKLRDDKR